MTASRVRSSRERRGPQPAPKRSPLPFRHSPGRGPTPRPGPRPGLRRMGRLAASPPFTNRCKRFVSKPKRFAVEHETKRAASPPHPPAGLPPPPPTVLARFVSKLKRFSFDTVLAPCVPPYSFDTVSPAGLLRLSRRVAAVIVITAGRGRDRGGSRS